MKSRIKDHRKVRVGDLVPHELNPRVHSDEQREALQALLGRIGFARSLLAYEIKCTACDGSGDAPIDGSIACKHCHGAGYKLKLIDGHLRQSELDSDEEVEVEILDVNDEEARALLLSIDPLAALADYDDKALTQLREITETDNATLGALWASLKKSDAKIKRELNQTTQKPPKQEVPEQFLVLIECSSEKEQIDLLRKLKKEGMSCRAMTS